MKRQHISESQRTSVNPWQWLWVLLCLFGTAMPAFAQHNLMVQGLQEHRKNKLQEKLFLHLDRPQYACGETMWFKVYYVDGTLHQPLSFSKVAYVEVLDQTKTPVLQAKVALKKGTGNGSFVLPLSLNSGNYTVRAYTSWMKNFSPDFYFEQPVTILNTYIKPGLQPLSDTVYSLQFFPEGGNLVAGLQSRVAFKIEDSRTGKGAAATGEVHDPEGNVLSTFQPLKAGIGHFDFTPASDTDYTAIVKVEGRQVLSQKLPKVFEQGYVLRLQEEGKSDVKISVASNPEQPEQLYLLGHARQMIAVAATVQAEGGAATFLVSKDSLADGITHFTLFNSRNQPVCERLYFKRPVKQLEIEATVNQTAFSKREQVVLDILAKAGAGKPATANLSLAVYRLDETLPSNAATDISAYFWLTSELKGNVEDALSYFSDESAQANEAIDNLMMTHGWSRFRWEVILAKKTTPIAFLPEHDGHLVQGRVTYHSTGAPAPGIRAFLAAPSRHIRLYNDVSNATGNIQFELKDFFGPRELVVQTDTRKDSTYRFEIFSPFSAKHSSRSTPGFDLNESWHHAITMRHTETEAQQLYHRQYLDRFKPAGVGSPAYYGEPDQKYLLDDYTRFKVMEEVMREYVPGVLVRRRRGRFHFKVINSPAKSVFQSDPLVLLDGVPVFDTDKIMAFDPLKVQQLDIITNRFYQGSMVNEGIVSYTTYKGDLAGFPLDPRALLLEYDGVQLEREFYAPAYATAEQKQSRLPDYRNLLYWAPELITKADGKASLSFYTSDSAGTYLLVVQGLTTDGQFGSKTLTFEVKQPL